MFSWQDNLVIGVYFTFMVIIGLAFSRSSKNSSDYFRGGGSMSWWMTGASVFMANFSAWTFVAASGRIYATGTMIIFTSFILQSVFGIILAVHLAHRYRRMRVISPVDAIYQRYGRTTEQIFAWHTALSRVLFSGVALYTLCIFVAPLLGISLGEAMIFVGFVVVFMSVSGGSWAVVASDFIQHLVLCVITVIMLVLTLSHKDVGGVSGFVEQLPPRMFDWTLHNQLPVLIIFVVALTMWQFLQIYNLMMGAGRFLTVRSDTDAKKAAWFYSIGFLIGPFIWFVPPMAATFLFPDIASMFPDLKNPEEMAYMVVAIEVLPKGMLGMLGCGIFAATMSALDTSINQNSAVIVRNIYLPLLRPNASERELLIVGKSFSTLAGVIMITGGFAYAKYSNVDLFAFNQHFNAILLMPLIIPLCLGLLVRKTPKLTPIIAIGVLLLVSMVLKFLVDYNAVAESLGWRPMDARESADLMSGVIYLAGGIVGVIIYLVAALLYKRFPLKAKDQERLDELYTNMETPVLADSDEHQHTDRMQCRKMGGLCLSYGTVLMLGVLLPNDIKGRICFLICGAVVAGIGAILWRKQFKLK
jgi:Na+/proline symporter